MVMGILLLILLPAVMLGILLVQQANGVFADFQNGSAQRLLARVDIPSHLLWVQRFAPTFDPASISPERLLLPVVREIPGWVARNGAAIVGSVAGIALTFAMVLLSAFFFYVEGETILAELAILSPLPADTTASSARSSRASIDATFRGHIFTAIAQGVVTGIGLAIAHVPAAIFWGFVAAVLSLLPMVGAAVVWVPAAIYLFISASMGDRATSARSSSSSGGSRRSRSSTTSFGPGRCSGNAHLPAIPLLFSVLGGMHAFGFIGLVIGPLVFSLLMSMIDIYKRSFGIPHSESEIA